MSDNFLYSPKRKELLTWNEENLKWIPAETLISKDGIEKAWDEENLKWVPTSSFKPDPVKTQDEAEEPVVKATEESDDVLREIINPVAEATEESVVEDEPDIAKEADPTVPLKIDTRPAYGLFADEKGTPTGKGAGSLRPVGTQEEQAKTRTATAIAGGLPLLPSDPISPMLYSAIGNVVGSVANIPQFLGELFLPETTKEVVDSVSKIDEKASENKIYDFFRDSFRGEDVPETDEMISRIPAYLFAGKLTKDAAKKIAKRYLKNRKKLTKAATIVGGGTGFVASDVLTRKDDEIFAPELANLINVLSGEPEVLKEAVDIINKLEINPEDSTQLKRQKQLIDAFGIQTAFGVALSTLFKTPKAAKGLVKAAAYPLKIRRYAKAVDDGVTEVPPVGKNSVVDSSEVVEEIVDGQPVVKQRNRMTEVVAKLNTKVGRAFASGAGLPQPIAKAAIVRSRSDKAAELEVKSAVEELLKVQKETKTSDDVLREIINRDARISLDPSKVDPKMIEAAALVRRTIDANEAKINKLLGLTGDDKIGLGFKKGEVYFTRSFEAVNNPSYLKQIKTALEFKGTGEDWVKLYDSDFLAKVQNARNYLKENGVPEKDIDNTISSMVANLSGSDGKSLLSDMFKNVSNTEGLTSRAAQVLRKRKTLEEPILELLGVEKDSVARIAKTLSNQKKVIAELEYFTEVDKYFRQNIGERAVELGGLFARGPKQRVGVFQQGDDVDMGGFKGVQETAQLSDMAEEAIGRFGGSTKLLKNLKVTPQTYEYVRKGLQYFEPQNNSWYGRAFSQTAALGQATQTILDIPAYFVNTAGAFQSLISNGHLFNTKIGSQAAEAVRTFGTSFERGRKGTLNKKALEKLTRLQREGVIDTDLTGELIAENISVYGRKPGQKATDLYSKGMEKLSKAYGTPDTYSKLVAFEAEQIALKKMFPRVAGQSIKEYDDQIFSMAAQRVRDTMPSYAVASPLVKSLSRFPIGTYALFPSEMVRTTANQIRIGVEDVAQGLKNGNKAQMSQGLKRLTGVTTTGLGVDYALDLNNKAQGIDGDTQRGLDLLAADWAKGSRAWHHQPVMEVEGGKIISRATNSFSFDAQDFLKVPVRQMIGKLMAGGEVTDVEIKETIDGLRKSILGPYSNPKFVTEALFNIARQEYSEAPGEEGVSLENVKRVLDELTPALTPGTIQVLTTYLDSLKSEDVRGFNKGINEYGFPQTSQDTLRWMFTGQRPFTQDIEKSIGFKLNTDIRKIKSSKDAFINKIRKLKDQPYNEKLENSLVEEYDKLQNAKYKSMRDLADKIKIFSKMKFEKLDGSRGDVEYTRVLKGLTDTFSYDIPEEALLAAYTKSMIKDSLGEDEFKGVFIADDIVSDERFQKLLRDKKFGTSLYKKLAEKQKYYTGLSLRD
jgi:hypothetical protein